MNYNHWYRCEFRIKNKKYVKYIRALSANIARIAILNHFPVLFSTGRISTRRVFSRPTADLVIGEIEGRVFKHSVFGVNPEHRQLVLKNEIYPGKEVRFYD